MSFLLGTSATTTPQAVPPVNSYCLRFGPEKARRPPGRSRLALSPLLYLHKLVHSTSGRLAGPKPGSQPANQPVANLSIRLGLSVLVTRISCFGQEAKPQTVFLSVTLYYLVCRASAARPLMPQPFVCASKLDQTDTPLVHRHLELPRLDLFKIRSGLLAFGIARFA